MHRLHVPVKFVFAPKGNDDVGREANCAMELPRRIVECLRLRNTRLGEFETLGGGESIRTAVLIRGMFTRRDVKV